MKSTNTFFGKSLTLAAAVSMSTLIPAFAEQSSFETDYTIQLEIQLMKGQFQYKNSTLNNVSKATVDYYLNSEKSQLKPYEYIWCNSAGYPIGLERRGKFGLEPGKSATLVVKHKANGTNEEIKGAASVILRLVLDAYHNTDSVMTIRVPPNSFQGIITALMDLRCVDEAPAKADQASRAKLTFTISDGEDNGQLKHLFYM